MNAESDLQLLRAYAARRDEAAFRELVQRHADFVYSAALRQVESDAAARDLTQGVFTDLARKAPDIHDKQTGDSLAGWLHRATRYAALNHLRDVRRRIHNERQAMEQLLTNSDSPADWEQIRPLLDEALDSLADDDREALLLRYFNNQDLRTVGAQLGVSDDAAQKRVSRAVERLREFFAKRGVTVGAGGLVVVISANAVQAAPIGLAVAISTAAATITGTTLATTTTATAAKAIAMTTLQKTLLTATIAITAGAGIFQAHEASRLRDQAQTLQKQHTEQIQQLQGERDQAAGQLAALREDVVRLNRNADELLRLRGEVTRLRQQASEITALRTENNQLRNRATVRQAEPSTTSPAAEDPVKQLNRCINNLRQIDAAMQQCALEHRLTVANVLTVDQIVPYLQGTNLPACPAGGSYTFGSLTNAPTCSIPSHNVQW